MEAYRDQYATLFHNGRNVVVIGISVDADSTLADWAHDSDFPIAFASDRGSVVGKMYGAYDAKYHVDNRSLFVVAPDGRITYVAKPFQVLSPAAYTALGAAIDRLEPRPSADSAS